MKKEIKKPISKNKCHICGEKVMWGIDGCPVVDKGNEMSVLFGLSNIKYMQHYNCGVKLNSIR